MSKKKIVLGVSAVVVLGALYGVFHMPRVGDAQLPTGAAAIERGKYIFDAGGCGACHSVPILHSRPYQGGSAQRCESAGDHGSDLGRRRNACWRGVCALRVGAG